jgi:hypothetical protein
MTVERKGKIKRCGQLQPLLTIIREIEPLWYQLLRTASIAI